MSPRSQPVDPLATLLASIHKLLNPYEETVTVLALLEHLVHLERDELVPLLKRIKHGAYVDRVPEDVDPEVLRTIHETFDQIGIKLTSFVQHRLPLLALPDDLKEALMRGSIPYNAANLLRRVSDDEQRRELLREVEAGLLADRVRGVLRRLPRRLERISERTRREIEAHLEAIERLLQES